MKPDKIDHALLWVDLETTGLDKESCLILEVGWCLTDLDFRVLSQPQSVLPRIPTGATHDSVYPDQSGEPYAEDDFVVQMHRTSGLWNVRRRVAQMDTFASLQDIQTMILMEIDEFVGPDPTGARGGVTLAGAGVSTYDQPLFTRWMPRIIDRVTYWTLDVSQTERFSKIALGLPPRGQAQSAVHRVIPDIQDALMTARILAAGIREGNLPERIG